MKKGSVDENQCLGIILNLLRIKCKIVVDDIYICKIKKKGEATDGRPNLDLRRLQINSK